MQAGRIITVSAPGRANLLGNPSDQYAGSQISCSAGMRACVELVEHDALVLQTGGTRCVVALEDVLAPQGDLFDLARVALADAIAHGATRPSVRLSFETEIPLRSGLAGSTALLVALVQALAAWSGGALAPHALAERARRIEAERMKITCGFGDQYMAAFGGLRYLDFRGKAPHDAVDPAPYATVETLAIDAARLPFVLAFTGVRHSSGAVHRPIRERWLAGEPAAVEGQARIAALARIGKRALLEGELDDFGGLMNENHAVQRDLGGSGESNERLIAAALAAGARGAKLAGAGDGGTVIALARDGPDARARLEAALHAAGATATWPLTPDSRGTTVAEGHPCTPAATGRQPGVASDASGGASPASTASSASTAVGDTGGENR